MARVHGTLKTFKRYILKLLNNMQRSVLLRVVRASGFCCLTIKKLRERRGLGNLRHFKDQPTEKSGIVYDNLFLSSQACGTNKLSTDAASVREALETVRQFFGCKLEFDILMLDGREVRFAMEPV